MVSHASHQVRSLAPRYCAIPTSIFSYWRKRHVMTNAFKLKNNDIKNGFDHNMSMGERETNNKQSLGARQHNNAKQ